MSEWALQLRGRGILWYFGRESNISKHPSTASFSFCLAPPPDVDSGAMMASTGLDTKWNGARKEWPLKTIHQAPNSSPQKITLRGTHISHPKAVGKMNLLFNWWDMLVPWRVSLLLIHWTWFNWLVPSPSLRVRHTSCVLFGSIRPDSIESSHWNIQPAA